MKQQVLSNAHGGRISSPSVAARTRVPRAAAAATPIKEAPSSPAPAPATPPRARRLVRVSSKEERVVTGAAAKPKRHKEDSEEETRKLRGEVEALRKEVERLQLLNTELECDKSDLTHQLALARCTITRLQEQHDIYIKTDVETKGDFINGLINKVQTTTYTDVEQVLTFVDWLDQQLSTLSDETGVLKHFSWPERKADALREAAFEYRDLKCVVTEISSLNADDGSPTSCEATLRKISSLLDKLEKSMKRLVNLRSSVMPCYKQFGIPTEWMLDSGIASKMRVASVTLAKVYMKRALKEITAYTGGGNEAALVAQSVRFTYRVHQFAGGLDSEAMRAFEELTQRSRLTAV
ncbi:hypothetical protein CFC21_052582 [Triticum aestivum]|uniref:Protein CHUP1, chloroplastic n=3 Tax=Triticum TaxID=4564 RepID=A0A9R0SCJ9_TRITD|nr:hypothetical protein CFC21_052582 [Triticum aestivum]VAH92490.1 unnamed protein product [Triticum turgidum subsp. durum]